MIIVLIIFMFVVFGGLGYYLGFRVGGEEDRKLTADFVGKEKTQIAKEIENWRLAKVQYQAEYRKIFSKMKETLISLGAEERATEILKEIRPRMRTTRESALEEFYESLKQSLNDFPKPDISIRIPRE